MEPLTELIAAQGFAVLDGGLATELERRGFDVTGPLWSARALMDAPELIQAVHLDYFKSGADVATTASYQATLGGFERCGASSQEARELLCLSVRLAKAARERFAESRPDRPRPFVAASIGCYGAALADGSEYRGRYGLSVDELMDFHRERIAILAKERPDVLACETLPCRIEAEALCRLLSTEFPEARAWMTFSCRDETRVWEGQTLLECARVCESCEQIVAVGINCTAPHLISPLLESLAGEITKPLVVYPNSGELWDAERRCWTGGAKTDFIALTAKWHGLGARVIGGCCRTTPEMIRTIRAALEEI